MSVPPQPSWAPLGIDSWHPDNFGAALSIAQSQIENFHAIGKSHCAELGGAALQGSLTEQAARNNKIHGLSIDDKETRYRLRMGLCQPDEAVRLFHGQPDIDSMEIARLTHVGDWDTNEKIDIPVRTALHEAEDIDTQPLPSDAYYKIRTFGYYEQLPDIAHIARKREVASHFGSSVLTVVVNNILIDLKDKHRDSRALRVALHQEARQTEGKFDRNTRHGYLHDMLDDQVRTRAMDKKPSALIPLSTIYYVTRPEARGLK